MATPVPYSGTLDVSPEERPISRAFVDTPPAAFGADVGQAISHMGEVEQGVGRELVDRAYSLQELNEQMKADAAAADTMNQMTDRYLQYDQLKGQERIDGAQQYKDDLNKIRQDGTAGLMSPYAKMHYLQYSRRTQSMMLWHGGVLARQGQDEATDGALIGKMDSVVNNYSKVNPADPDALNDAVANIKKTAQDYVHFKRGFAPGTADSDNAIAPIISSRVAKMIVSKSDANPVMGKKLFEQSKSAGLLSPEDADRIEERIYNGVDLKTAKGIAHDVAGDPKNRHVSPQAVEKAARDKAEQLDPGNKNLSDNAADLAVARQGHERAVEQEAWRESQDTLIRGIDGTDTQGKVPLSLDEAMEDPTWRDRYNSAPPEVQGRVRDAIRKNQTTDGWVPNEEGTKEFNNLYSIFKDPRSSAAEVDSALNTDLLKTSMTREQRKTIMDLQSAVLKDQSSATNVNSAMNIAEVQQAVKEAGLQKGTDAYTKFVTDFTTAIGEYAQGAHRTVKDHKQLGEIAQKMLLHQTTQHLGGWWNTNSPSVYQNILEAQPQLKAQAIRTWTRMYGTEPTPEQLQSLAPLYYNKFFRELGAKSRPEQSKMTNRAQ